MKVFIALSMLIVAAVAQLDREQYAPIPYSFNYISEMEDGGKSGHEESGDGSGRVTGSYTVSNLEGHTRVVDYIADENGFRATIRSNEPGTVSSNPADVTMESSSAESGPVLNSALSSSRTTVSSASASRTSTSRTGGTGVRYVLVPIND